MDALERFRVPAVLAFLGGSLEFAVALPETFRPPVQPDAITLTILAVLMIVSGVMIYGNARPRILWGVALLAGSLLVIVIGGPLEGFEIFAAPLAFTGGLLAILANLTRAENP